LPSFFAAVSRERSSARQCAGRRRTRRRPGSAPRVLLQRARHREIEHRRHLGVDAAEAARARRWSRCARFCGVSSPANSAVPVSISLEHHAEPKRCRSAGPTGSPATCSGDMKRGVPMTMPVLVLKSSLRMRAMPKSMILAWPRGSSMMLPGLMSRCTTPRSCAKPSPSATCCAMSTESAMRADLLHPRAQVVALEQPHGEIREVVLLAEVVGG